MNFFKSKYTESRYAFLYRYCFLAMAISSLPAQARNWPSAVGEGNISRWSGDRISAFTVTIDDNHAQDHSFWQELGEEYGLKWTWCVITENVGSGNGGTWAQWQELVDLGHGIASHGLHAYDETTSGVNVTNEYRDSQFALTNNLTDIDALTLAYPNGLKPPNDKVLAADYYIAARGVVGGVNTGASIDYMDPKSVSMNTTTAPGITDPGTWYYYGHAINPSHQYYEGWQSVHFHNVSAAMVAGVTNLAAALSANEADIWTGRFQDVAQYGQERENATLTVDSVSGSEIRFTVADTLDDTLFYFPLTVKVRIDSAWDEVTAIQNGASVPVAFVENAGNKYALVQAVPDAGQVTLQQGSSEGLLVVVRSPSKNRVWVDGGFIGTASGAYDAPYQTIQEGLNAAAAGEIVTVRGGMYREQIILPSGTANEPLTLAAAPGERVVLNAMVPLINWQAITGGLYSIPASWAPAALYSGFRKMTPAREPNEGWWEADSVSENVPAATVTIMDAANLTDLPYDLENASVYIWNQTTDRFYTCPIVSFDPELGHVEFENVNAAMSPAAGDKYWLQNQVSLIDLPGEWASEPEGGNYRIYCWPTALSDLEEMQVPPVSGRPVSGQNVAHVRLEGLEVVGGADRGIYLLDAQDVEINRCIVHNNQLYGVWMRNGQDCSIENSILVNNRFGLVCEESTNMVVEANEIGPNSEDGLVLARNTSNVWIRNNYIHDHMLWGHPDNAQMFLGVSGVHFINNLLMTGGQSVMLEQTTDAEFTGNMVIGSGANMLSFGHGTVTNVTLHGNTLSCSGYANMGLTGSTAYDVTENIFMTGHGSQLYTVTDAMNYQGDRNLFWNADRLVDPILLVTDGTWGGGPGGPPEPFRIVYENNDVATIDLTANVDVVHSNFTASVLAQHIGSAAGWPNALTGIQNNGGISSLAGAISAADYFSFTVTPDAESVVSYTNLFIRSSMGANVQPAETTFTLMSSLTGFTSSDGLASFTSATAAASSVNQNTLDLSGIVALQDVTAGTVVEFRLYAHNTGENPMTRVGIGHLFYTGSADDDLRLSGMVSSEGGVTKGPAETIYHTSLATFQTTTGQDLNSANSNPLFVNAPLGINVMDNALLDEATRDTFSLRDSNGFLVGDHVEINFDGVVRTVITSSGSEITVSPALSAKPLKGYLIANWGTNSNFALDLGLQQGSPGMGLGQGGTTVGSPILIQEYLKGDFDGDGRRNLPEIPLHIFK